MNRRRRIGMVLGLAVAVLGPLLVLASQPAAACSCIASTEEQHLSSADVVFVGTALSRRDVGTTSTSVQLVSAFEWTFSVDEVVKGTVPSAREVVRTAANSAACGFEFEVGTRYRVYAARLDGVLNTGICSGTRAASDVQPTTTTPPTTSPRPGPSPGRVGFTG